MSSMQRAEYIDIAKGVMILLVVAGHLIPNYLSDARHTPLFIFIYSFHVPLFFMLSGYVMGLTEHRIANLSFAAWLWKKVQTLLVPFLIWTLLIYRFRTNIHELTAAFVRPDEAGAWFLISLFCIQVVCYPIVRYKKWLYYAIPVLLLLVAHLSGKVSFFYTNFIHYACYLAGYLLYHHRTHLLQPLTATATLCCFVIAESLYPHPILCAISFGIAVLYASRRWEELGGETIGYTISYC